MTHHWRLLLKMCPPNPTYQRSKHGCLPQWLSDRDWCYNLHVQFPFLVSPRPTFIQAERTQLRVLAIRLIRQLISEYLLRTPFLCTYLYFLRSASDMDNRLHKEILEAVTGTASRSLGFVGFQKKITLIDKITGNSSLLNESCKMSLPFLLSKDAERENG